MNSKKIIGAAAILAVALLIGSCVEKDYSKRTQVKKTALLNEFPSEFISKMEFVKNV
jgi:PBP1b-binding outer membrane lipoprotein LpoB